MFLLWYKSSSITIILFIISLDAGTADWLAQWYPYLGESIVINKTYFGFSKGNIDAKELINLFFEYESLIDFWAVPVLPPILYPSKFKL